MKHVEKTVQKQIKTMLVIKLGDIEKFLTRSILTTHSTLTQDQKMFQRQCEIL